MTTDEFSNQFDVLISAFSPQDTIVFDEYEKSVFLTQAQEEIVLLLYNDKGSTALGFETKESIRRYLHNLTQQFSINLEGATEASFDKPNDLLFITYETCTIKCNESGCEKTALVFPTKQEELWRILQNPFRGPSDKRVIRTDRNKQIQLISKYGMCCYTMDYLRRPKPIVLANFEDVSVNGESQICECELDEALHDIILKAAVEAALKTKINLTKTNV